VTDGAAVTVELSVSAGATGDPIDLINDLSDFNGIGDGGGLMVLVDGHYQFNLQTNGTDYTPGGHLYQSLVTVWYKAAPALTVGQGSAVLQSR
jgi:hypothetical protein